MATALLLLALVALLVTGGGFTAATGHVEWAWSLFGVSLGCLVVAVAALGSRR